MIDQSRTQSWNSWCRRGWCRHGAVHRYRRGKGIALGCFLVWVILVTPASVLSAQELPHRVTDGLADLRPEGLDVTAPQVAERGRALLRAAWERHGGAAWKEHATLQMTGTDFWREPGPWWPQQNQDVRLLQLLGTFTSRATLLDGPGAGSVWGLQSWRPYKVSADDSRPTFLDTDLAIEFYLTSLHYFNELPFRLMDAPIVADLGPEELHGLTYDRVFVTWNAPQPTTDADHYVVWIERFRGLITKTHYTVRDAATMPFVPDEQRPMMRAGAAGTIHFSDFRTVDGVELPFRHVVTMFGPHEAGPDPGESPAWVHIFEAREAAFDGEPAPSLLPDPTLPDPADRKP
ncbi:MAG: hypothetical protein MPN21_26440 [Thermoanaerobaculia bacterium]|nr:hypothetical protein [Thermoanaerobaculia bacterium]